MSGLSSFPPGMVLMDFGDIFLQFPRPSPLSWQRCHIPAGSTDILTLLSLLAGGRNNAQTASELLCTSRNRDKLL